MEEYNPMEYMRRVGKKRMSDPPDEPGEIKGLKRKKGYVCTCQTCVQAREILEEHTM